MAFSRGDYVLAVVEGYLIEDGRLTAPVRGTTLVGNGPETLKQMGMIGHDVALDGAQGFWIENGELSFPVNEVTIALPLDQLLKNVRAVANDLTFLPFGGAIGSPTFRVDGVMIGGSSEFN